MCFLFQIWESLRLSIVILHLIILHRRCIHTGSHLIGQYWWVTVSTQAALWEVNIGMLLYSHRQPFERSILVCYCIHTGSPLRVQYWFVTVSTQAALWEVNIGGWLITQSAIWDVNIGLLLYPALWEVNIGMLLYSHRQPFERSILVCYFIHTDSPLRCQYWWVAVITQAVF